MSIADLINTKEKSRKDGWERYEISVSAYFISISLARKLRVTAYFDIAGDSHVDIKGACMHEHRSLADVEFTSETAQRMQQKWKKNIFIQIIRYVYEAWLMGISPAHIHTSDYTLLMPDGLNNQVNNTIVLYKICEAYNYISPECLKNNLEDLLVLGKILLDEESHNEITYSFNTPIKDLRIYSILYAYLTSAGVTDIVYATSPLIRLPLPENEDEQKDMLQLIDASVDLCMTAIQLMIAVEHTEDAYAAAMKVVECIQGVGSASATLNIVSGISSNDWARLSDLHACRFINIIKLYNVKGDHPDVNKTLTSIIFDAY